MGSLNPVVNYHEVFYVFYEQIFSTNKPAIIFHEVRVERVEFDAKSFSRVSAYALVSDTKIVDNPHILFHMSDVRGLVVNRHAYA